MLSFQMCNAIKQTMDWYGIKSMNEMLIFSYMSICKRSTTKEIMTHCNINRTHIHKIMEKLKEKGLVESAIASPDNKFSNSPFDQIRLSFSLTEKGNEVAKEADAMIYRIMNGESERESLQ